LCQRRRDERHDPWCRESVEVFMANDVPDSPGKTRSTALGKELSSTCLWRLWEPVKFTRGWLCPQ
jgi:hypothetical protein